MSERSDYRLWAERFHYAYERLAPEFGYETREETRTFDSGSPNGRLMVAVAEEVIGPLQQRVRELEEALRFYGWADGPTALAVDNGAVARAALAEGEEGKHET